MDILCCALALLSGVIGAGFASGREIVRFFAAHGAMALSPSPLRLPRCWRCSALLPIRLGRRRADRPFRACAGRASGRASAGCAAHCSFCSPPSQAARCSRPARSFPRSSGRSATPMPSASPSRRCSAALLCAFETRGLAVVGGALCGLLPILLIRLLLLPPAKPAFCRKGRRTPFSARRWTARSMPR